MNGGNPIKTCVTASIAFATFLITRQLFGRYKKKVETERSNINEKEQVVGSDEKELVEVNKPDEPSTMECNDVHLSPALCIGRTSDSADSSAITLEDEKASLLSDAIEKTVETEISREVPTINRNTVPKAVEHIAGRRHGCTSRRPPKMPSYSKTQTNSPRAYARLSEGSSSRTWSSATDADNIKDTRMKRSRIKRDDDVVRGVAPRHVRKSRVVKTVYVISNDGFRH